MYGFSLLKGLGVKGKNRYGDLRRFYGKDIYDSKDCEKIAKLYVSSLFIKMILDTMSRLRNIPSFLQDFLDINTVIHNNNTPVYSLLDWILKCYIEGNEKVFGVYNDNGRLVLGEPSKNELENIHIHFNDVNIGINNPYPYSLLYSIYKNVAIIEDRLLKCGMQKGAMVAKVANLHKTPYSMQDAEEDFKEARDNFRDSGYTAVISNEDTLEILDFNFLDLIELKKNYYNKICHITGLPLSYVSGTTTGSLNTTGEGDLKQLENALEIFFNAYLKNIFNTLISIFDSSKGKVSFLQDNMTNLNLFLSSIEKLEQSSAFEPSELPSVIKRLAKACLDKNVYEFMYNEQNNTSD